MKFDKNRKQSAIAEPLLRDLAVQAKGKGETSPAKVTIGSDPLPRPDLYQDPGSGYNVNFTFPQE